MSIKISGLSHNYGIKEALNNVNLELHEGFNVLLGPNGAGKSTLFSLLTAQLSIQHGDIWFDKASMLQPQRDLFKQIGVVFQSTTLDLDLTVQQNLLYFAALHGISKQQALHQLSPILCALSLTKHLGEKVRQLNQGHRRRVELARSVLHEPKYLFLDEPTVGLDVPSRKAIIAYVRTLAATGVTILWTTHLLDEVQGEDQLILLNDGHVLLSEECQTALESNHKASVLELYQSLTDRVLEAI
jgi:ABC-2 type transport system ATP-binding protein